MAADAVFTSNLLHQGSSSDTMSSSSLSIYTTPDDLSSSQATELEIGTDMEPLQDEEVVQFRTKVLEMSLSNSEGITSREQELAQMVLRLTESSRPTSGQIASQAATIVDLSTQRDYLIQQIEEERARWQSEREGWDRASEALLTQRNSKDQHSTRQQELERYCSILRTDNEDLRRREQRLLKRLTALENEMVKLKPVLLLDPFPVTPSGTSIEHASVYLASLPYPAASGKEAARTQRSRKKKPANNSHRDLITTAESSVVPKHSQDVGTGTLNTPALDSRESDGQFPLPVPEQHNSITALSSDIHVSNRTEPPGTLLLWPSHIPPPGSPPPPPASPEIPVASVDESFPTEPSEHHLAKESCESLIDPPLASSLPKPAVSLATDARMEHLLLAARMIGRKRAAVVAGIVDAEWEKEHKERKEREKEKREREKAQRSKDREREKGKQKMGTFDDLTLSSGRANRAKKAKGKQPANSDGRTSKRTASRSEMGDERITDDELIVSSSKQTRTRQIGRPKPRPLSTPSSGDSSQRTQLTGMDSLLSAARSMMDPSSSQATARDEVNETQDSVHGGTKDPPIAGSEDNAALPPRNGVKAALDVLADQAAAAVSTSTLSTDGDKHVNWKETATEDDLGDEDAEGEYDEDEDSGVRDDESGVDDSSNLGERPRRTSHRSASARAKKDARVILSAKSPGTSLSTAPQ
ncbi:hypothetical protein C8R42DRAFT_665556 [Lentinula raphanica]|nr:hypothetical protein C8R42DRAFT_665556 [Lentinula raphanica]